MDEYLGKTLHGFGFHQRDLIAKFIARKRKISKELCYLLKPLKDEKEANYWRINNLDVRKSENWKFTEICSEDI